MDAPLYYTGQDILGLRHHRKRYFVTTSHDNLLIFLNFMLKLFLKTLDLVIQLALLICTFQFMFHLYFSIYVSSQCKLQCRVSKPETDDYCGEIGRNWWDGPFWYYIDNSVTSEDRLLRGKAFRWTDGSNMLKRDQSNRYLNIHIDEGGLKVKISQN